MVQDLASRPAVMLLSVALATAVLGAERPKDDEKSGAQSINITSRRPLEDAALDRALDQIVSADFRDAPPGSLSAFLKTHQIDAVLDAKALGDAGISTDAPLLNLQFARVSIRSLLKSVARQTDLEVVIRDGRALITTPDKSSNEILAKIYRVDDLLVSEDTPRNQTRDYSSLIDLITSTIYPSTWDEVGGPSSIGAYQGTLFIAQTYRAHETIDRLLSALRESRTQQRNNAGLKSIRVDSPQQIAALDNFRKKSILRADFEFDELPLVDAVAALAKAYDLPLMILDARSLKDAGIDKDTPVTAKLQQVSPEDVVDLLLGDLNLTFLLKDEVIWITTPDVASSEMDIVVYPVADLVKSGTVKIGASGQDFTSLMALITSSIHPATWEEVGGPGSIAPHRVTSSLVISQTRPAHLEISRLLAGIREIRVPPPPRPARANVPDDAQAARQVNRNSGGALTKVYPLPAGLDAKTVAALIQRLDRPSWNSSGRSLRLNSNQLIVRHTREMHRQIEELLRDGNVQPSTGGGMGGMGGGMGGGMF